MSYSQSLSFCPLLNFCYNVRYIYYKREYSHLYSFLCIFQLVFLAAFVAYVQAGGPAAYSISALSGDHAYVGSQQEHTVKVCQSRWFFFSFWWNIHFFWWPYRFFTSKGLYGQNVLSSYSKAVDSAHSSVRVSSSRQSNDILGKQIHSSIIVLIWIFVPVFIFFKYNVRYYVILFAHKLLKSIKFVLHTLIIIMNEFIQPVFFLY